MFEGQFQISAYLLSFTATVFIQFANLMTGVILARGLGPAARGELAALMAVVLSVTVIAGLSFSDALVFWLSRTKPNNHRYIGSGFVIAIAGGILGTAALLALAPVLQHIAHAPTTQLWPWFLYPLVAQMALYCVTVAQGMEMHKRWAFLRITTTANYAVLLICFVLADALHVRNIGFAAVGGQFLSVIFSVVALSGSFRGSVIDREALRAIWVYAIKLHPVSFPSLAREQFDKILLFYLVPPSDLGCYVVGIALGLLPVAAANTIDQVIFPALVSIADSEKRKEACLAQMRVVSALILAGMVIMLPLTPLAVRILFGTEYVVAVGVPTAAVAIGFLQSLKLVFNVGLKIEHRPGALGLNELIGMAFSLALMIPLVLGLGIYGAPLASAIGGSLALGLTIRKIKDIYAVSLREILIPHAGDMTALLARIVGSRPLQVEE
jgi:O-antigen/teichoic acid export membrane protein